jgi:dTDP-4-dehydrorhamnose 3,5-epimerase
MHFDDTPFDGLKIVRHLRAPDARGVLVKPWLAGELASCFGNAAEAYFSFSEKGVFRGLHYQRGDRAQKKYVVCLSGNIEDVALDLRLGSQSYGKVFRLRLDALNGVGVIIPEGFAHGIFAHVPSTIVNFCDKPYAPGDEGGVNWKSLDELSDLPVRLVSEKDALLPGRAEVLT